MAPLSLAMESAESTTALKVGILTKDADDRIASHRSRAHINQKQRVSFCNHCIVFEIPNLDSYSEEEICQTWMGPDDYEHARDEAEATAMLLEDGIEIPVDNKYVCALGIRVPDDLMKERLSQLKAYFAVFKEQEAQRKDGYSCEYLIAMSYMEHTEGARSRAHIAGTMLSREAGYRIKEG